MDSSNKKRNAAKASLEFVEPGAVVGIGTGSTVNELIRLLPTVKDRIDKVVSSSKASSTLLQELGFEVSTLNEVGPVDIYIDGADEANKRLHLLKGGGPERRFLRARHVVSSALSTKASSSACSAPSLFRSRSCQWRRPMWPGNS